MNYLVSSAGARVRGTRGRRPRLPRPRPRLGGPGGPGRGGVKERHFLPGPRVLGTAAAGAWGRGPANPSARPGPAKAGVVGDAGPRAPAGCWKDRSGAAGRREVPGSGREVGRRPAPACRPRLPGDLGLRAGSPSPPLHRPEQRTRGPLGREFPGGGVVLLCFGDGCPCPRLGIEGAGSKWSAGEVNN